MGKIIFTDHTFDPLDVEQAIIQAAGAVMEAHQCKTREQMVAAVSDADAVITQFAQVDAQAIAAMKRARAIVRYGVGVDNVDLEAARQHNIPARIAQPMDVSGGNSTSPSPTRSYSPRCFSASTAATCWSRCKTEVGTWKPTPSLVSIRPAAR